MTHTHDPRAAFASSMLSAALELHDFVPALQWQTHQSEPGVWCLRSESLCCVVDIFPALFSDQHSGRWHVDVTLIENDSVDAELCDGFPRYYFALGAALLETELWLKARGELPAEEAA
ncbi:MAG: hypothetical protein AAFN18_22745 [Cyanobacteria bacterium J06554_6]